MPPDDTTPPRRPVSVVRADGDTDAVARQLAAAYPGPSVDLERQPVPVTAEDIARVAAQVVDGDADAQARAHEQQAAALTAVVEAADAVHHAADTAIEAHQAEQRRLVEGANWCDERGLTVDVMLRDAAAAESAEVEAQARLATADVKVAAVTEQRAAAEGVLGEARRQLAEMDVAGQGENEVRRSLERAGQVARDAEAHVAAHRDDVERHTAEIAAAEARLTHAEQALQVVHAIAARDAAAVARALARFEGATLLDATPDDLALAREIERLVAAVDPSAPADAEALSRAEAAVEHAQTALAALIRPADHVMPDWWDELARRHAAVVDAESATGGTFARRGQRRLQEALAAERALLVEIGYPSHLDALLSGGRPAGERRDPAAVTVATQSLDRAEAHLALLREHDATATQLRRLREVAGARLGRPAADVLPDDLRRPRPDPAAAADLAAAMGIADAPENQLAAIARAWLAEHRGAAASVAAADAEHREATAAIEAGGAALAAAAAALAAAEVAARDARARVAVLEAELGNRMVPAADPATRAATAAAMRDRIGALEARVATAEAEAARERAAAATALAAATASLAAAQRAVHDVTTRLAALALLTGRPPVRSGDLAADLAATARALRQAANAGQPDGGAQDIAEAAAAATAAHAALERHQATSPGEVGDAALAEAVHRLLDPAHRASDVLVEPLHAAPDDQARAALLEAIAAAGARRGLLVVTDDEHVLSWAIELSDDVGGLVPLAALQSGPIPAEEPTQAAPASRTTDPAQPAR